MYYMYVHTGTYLVFNSNQSYTHTATCTLYMQFGPQYEMCNIQLIQVSQHYVL